MAPIKEQWLQIRVDPQRKQMLERAADATRQSLSAFVLQAASQHAEEVLAERRVIDFPPQAARGIQRGARRTCAGKRAPRRRTRTPAPLPLD